MGNLLIQILFVLDYSFLYRLDNMPFYQADSTKNETEETTLVPSIDDDDDDRNDNSKSNRYKYVAIAAAVSALGLATGTSSSSIGSLLLRQDNAGDDADKVMAAVEGNILDVGCVGKYHACAGAGKGNCCGGLECDGPFFGTCQYSGCGAVGDKCAGFGQGNCCDGGVCCFDPAVGWFVPGVGTCDKYHAEGSCGRDDDDDH